MLTIEGFKAKHKKLIDLGVIRFSTENPIFGEVKTSFLAENPSVTESQFNELIKPFIKPNYIIIDRFVNDVCLVENHNVLSEPRKDVKRLGYSKDFGVGVYSKLL